MADKSYQDAVQVLKSRLGGRWEGAENDGRREMIRILRDELGFSESEAGDALKAMAATNQLRYRSNDNSTEDGTGRATGTAAVAPATGGIGTGTTGVPAAGGVAGVPVVPAMLPAIGYWEVGDTDDETAPGRGGQVTPSGL